jgi:hypothetical protein
VRSEAYFREHKGAKDPRREEIYEDYWTDRKRLLVRMPDRPDAVFRYYDNNISPETLLERYAHWTIFSYDSACGGAYRFWNGLGRDGRGRGVVGTRAVTSLLGLFMFPPLGVSDPAWGQVRTWHVIDEFYARPLSEMRVLGKGVVSGKEVVLLEHMEMRPPQSASTLAQGRKVEWADITTAWVDVDRGCLPLRMETWSELMLDGVFFGTVAKTSVRNPGGQKAYVITEIHEIRKFDGGGFYPVKGVIRNISPDPDYRGPFNTLDGTLAGKVVDVPTVEFTRWEWEAVSVEPNVLIPETSLALKFPKGTAYTDETLSKPFIEGLSPAELERLLEEEAGRGRERPSGVSPWRSVLVAVSVAAILAVVAGFAWRRWNRK